MLRINVDDILTGNQVMGRYAASSPLIKKLPATSWGGAMLVGLWTVG